MRECALMPFLGMGKAVAMMKDFYGLVDNVAVLKHEDTLSLGKNTLKFLFTPLVHWPETMMTYMVEEKILFSCDAFGSYGCLDGFLFDDEASDRDYFEREALRYFTNIVAAFSRNVLMAIDKVSPYPIEILAPSHGLVWRKSLSASFRSIKVGYYGHRASRARRDRALRQYVPQHRARVDFALQAVAEQGVPLEVFNVAVTDPSFILPSLWTKRGLLVACPTYERAMFPPMVHALNIAEIKGVRNKIAGYFGSYAWSGGAKAVFEEFAAKLNWDVVGALEFIGSAKEADIQQIQAISRQIAGRSK